MATAARSLQRMERKTIRISEKRQITIPQKYFDMLGFHDEAECILRGNELVLRPAVHHDGGELAEAVLADLIAQGYQGDALLSQFKEARRKIRPAVEAMLEQADALAGDPVRGPSLDELFAPQEP